MSFRRFTRFAAIDWSGAKGARQKGIAVAVCNAGEEVPALLAPGGGWSRLTILDWLLAHADGESDMLIGVDFSHSLPFADRGAFFPDWPDSPADARALWRIIDEIGAADDDLSASAFIDHAEISRHFRRHGGLTGDLFGTGAGRMRVVEQDCRDGGHGAAQSCFNLVGAAQVGKSSLTGMRVLHRLTDRIPIWPFDPVPERGPLIVEIYTSIAARTAGLRGGRSKIRDPATLDRLLAAHASRAHAPLARYDDHSTDAILTAAWLRRASADARLWKPGALARDPALARTEGWTFGVP